MQGKRDVRQCRRALAYRYLFIASYYFILVLHEKSRTSPPCPTTLR